jgi:peptide/nickel transport system substrate-binding protein
VALDANPNAATPPKSKRILILHRPDSSAQLLALQKGDVDIARNLSPEQIKTVQANPDFQTVQANKATVLYLAMNQNNVNLAKPQVRQAIKWAIDYKSIATNITPNIFVEQQAFLPKGLPGALTDLPFSKNVTKAKGLMKEAGLENGFEVTLDCQNVSPFADIAQALQADLGAIGIKLNILPAEFRQVITKTRARKHELVLTLWGSDYMDPNSNSQTFCENLDNGDEARDRTLAWRSSWQNKELTQRSQAAVREQDADTRVRAYERLQRDLQEVSPFAIMLQQVAIAASRKNVSGLAIGPLSDSTNYADLQKA